MVVRVVVVVVVVVVVGEVTMVVQVGSVCDAVTVSVLGRVFVTVSVLGVIVVADVDVVVVVAGEVTVAVVVLGSVSDGGAGSLLGVVVYLDVTVVSEGMVKVVVVLLVSLSNAGAVLAKHSKHDTWPSPTRQSKHRPSVGVVNGLRVVYGLMDSAKPVLITIRVCSATDGPTYLVVCGVVVEVPRTS